MDSFHSRKNLVHQGYTLIEVTVTVVLIGTIVAFALPNFSITAEKSRSSEGVQVLTAVLKAQNLYAFENGAVTSNLTDLDIDIPTSATFGAPVLSTANGQTAYIDQSNGDYRLYIDTAANITCDDSPGVAGICARMGFTAYPF